MRYRPSELDRDLRLDLLRGACVLMMVVVHLGHPPIRDLLRHRAFWTAAEGFFLLSGVILGIVYRRRLAKEGLTATTRRLWRRAARLWIVNLAVAVLRLAIDLASASPARLARAWGDPPWLGLLHLDMPYLLHVLPRYAVFLLFAPGALALLRRGRTGWLVATCVVLWSVGLARWRDPGLPWLEPGDTRFPVLAWQAPFFVGVVLGWHRDRVAAWWRRRQGWALGVVLVAGVGAFVVLRMVLRGQLSIPWMPRPDFERAFWIGRRVLGPLRWLSVGSVAALVFLLVDRFWTPIARWTGPLLLTYGQNALFVYVAHMLLAIGVRSLERQLPSAPRVLWLAVDAGVVASLWLLARHRAALGMPAPGSRPR